MKARASLTHTPLLFSLQNHAILLPLPPPSHRTDHHQANVIIVGAGVFDAAIATALVHQFRSVVLLERPLYKSGRIVGELMRH